MKHHFGSEFLVLLYSLHDATRLVKMNTFKAHRYIRCTFKMERDFARTRRNQDLACEAKVEATLIIDSVHIALRITQ